MSTATIPANFDSKFRYVLLIAKRAEQLMQGSLPKMDAENSKPTRVARREVDADMVGWEITPLGEAEE